MGADDVVLENLVEFVGLLVVFASVDAFPRIPIRSADDVIAEDVRKGACQCAVINPPIS